MKSLLKYKTCQRIRWWSNRIGGIHDLWDDEGNPICKFTQVWHIDYKVIMYSSNFFQQIIDTKAHHFTTNL